MTRATAIVFSALACLGLGAGQDEKPSPKSKRAELKLDQHGFTFDYEPIGDSHAPGSLAVGLMWSPGASPMVLTIEAPLRVGDALLAPGRYRVFLARTAEDAWALRAENAPLSIAAGKKVAGNLDLTVTRSVASPPASKLDSKWALLKAEKDGGMGLTLTLRIGPDAFQLRGTTWAGTERSTQGWTAHAWPLPADFVGALAAAGTPAPFVTLRHADGQDPKRTRVFNLLVCGDLIAVAAASEGPGPDGATPVTESPQFYASGAWKPSKDKSLLIGAPLIDIRMRQGIYMHLNDGARTVSFSVTEPDYGKKKK